ncbi:MAG: glycosyltransferase family 4 protein [Rhodospirillales bacterium]
MQIAIVSDAWHPQRNGVVRVLESIIGHLEARGDRVSVIAPDKFRTLPCPTYPEIRLALMPGSRVTKLLDAAEADAIHIATEGPLGQAARSYCLKRGLPFTTAYHSKFPEYINERTGVPLSWLYGWMRRFHGPARRVLAPSPSVYRELMQQGFPNAVAWSHGVDTDTFYPRGKGFFEEVTGRAVERPLNLYIGRVTVDKNLPGFLDLDLPGSKVVVGDGPSRKQLMKRYPDVLFHLCNGDDQLARAYSDGDVFVFPSRTDTFGLVMLEAMACGVPVAAFPVTGPLDVIGHSRAGVLDEHLAVATARALSIPSHVARDHAEGFSWARATDEFRAFLAPLKPEADALDAEAVPVARAG